MSTLDTALGGCKPSCTKLGGSSALHHSLLDASQLHGCMFQNRETTTGNRCETYHQHRLSLRLVFIFRLPLRIGHLQGGSPQGPSDESTLGRRVRSLLFFLLLINPRTLALVGIGLSSRVFKGSSRTSVVSSGLCDHTAIGVCALDSPSSVKNWFPI